MPLVYSVPCDGGLGRGAAPHLVVYGDGFTAEVPGEGLPSYARSLADALAAKGLTVSVVGCGIPGAPAQQLNACSKEKVLRDAQKRAGVGLEVLASPLERGARRADLVLLMAGANDVIFHTKSYNMLEPTEIVDSLKALHAKCAELGAQTVVLGLPDLKGSPEIVARCQAVNGALAKWVRGGDRERCPKLFVNTGALLPSGPAARKAGLWSGNLSWSETGRKVLGERLAVRLAPLVASICAELVLTAGGSDKGADAPPPVEAFMQALDHADNAGGENAKAGANGTASLRLEEWELVALRCLQLTVRRWLLQRRVAATGARRPPRMLQVIATNCKGWFLACCVKPR